MVSVDCRASRGILHLPFTFNVTLFPLHYTFFLIRALEPYDCGWPSSFLLEFSPFRGLKVSYEFLDLGNYKSLPEEIEMQRYGNDRIKHLSTKIYSQK